MNSYYAMVIHRCMVAGQPTDYLDLSAYFFRAESEDEVRSLIENEEPHSYVGGEGDDVKWTLLRIMSIDPCDTPDSGQEVTGFITSSDELGKLV